MFIFSGKIVRDDAVFFGGSRATVAEVYRKTVAKLMRKIS